MLTKLEVNGFKNLLDFSVSFGPFTCIAGLNGVGKSNIFDAIRFLSLLAKRSIVEAAIDVRSTESADLLDIFWTDGAEIAEQISLAVEMIVPAEIVDDFGRSAVPTSTFLRYEVVLGRELSDNNISGTRLFLVREKLAYINKGDASNHLLFPLSAKEFRNNVVFNKRRNVPEFISSDEEHDQTIIRLHQDGGSRGGPQSILARNLPRTVVANTNSSDWPTILAARREMESWWFLSLEPTAMRRSNRFHENGPVSASGGGLAGALYRLYREDQNVLTRIASRLTAIVPTSEVKIDVDEVRQLLTVEVKERSGAFLPARSLSDGTLRFLALCIMAEDPKFGGLLCFEEPENGIHPAKMGAMLALVKELAVNPFEVVGEDNPLRQIIVATHSPVLVGLESPQDLIYADVVKIKGPTGNPTSTIRCKSLQESWRVTGGAGVLQRASIIAYLSLPPDSQITLPLDHCK